MKRRKIRIVQHKRLPRGDFGYWDSEKREIHILTPKAMYSHVLRHEQAHARGSIYSRLSENFDSALFNYGLRILATLSGIALFGYIFFGLLGPIYTRLFWLSSSAAVVMIFFFSRMFYWMEEFRAERLAKKNHRTRLKAARNRQSSRPEHSQEPDMPELQQPLAIDGSSSV